MHPDEGDNNDPFTLDDVFSNKQKNRLRFTSRDIKRGETEMVSFRCDLQILHRMQVIVESGEDPELQTKTDILLDAVHLWLTRWDEDHDDPRQRKLAYQFRMRELRRRLDHQKSFLESTESLLDALKNTGDVDGLKELLFIMAEAKFEFTDSPPDFLKKLQYMTDETRRLVKEAQ